jgi:hypothetical protein
MKTLVLLIHLVSLLTFSVFAQTGNSIPIEVKYNRTYVTLSIGSITIPNILLDTGFSYDGLMIFNPSYRDSLDLSGAFEVQVGGAGSGDAARALMIDSSSFSLGSTTMVNQPIIILQGNAGLGSNGIIGYSIFGHFLTEFDYDKNIMTLYNSDLMQIDDSWTTIPIYFKNNNIPWLDAFLIIDKEEPIPVSMYIDFAAGDEILLLEKPGMKFSLPGDTREIYIGKGLSGDIYGKTGTISKLIIGPYELNNIQASFADAKIRSKQNNADAILGNGSLRRFNIIFDYLNKKLYLKSNSHFKDVIR